MSHSQDEPFAERHRGRGAGIRPENRFETLHVLQDYEQLEGEEQNQQPLNTEYYDDTSKSVVSENNSPDLPFRYSVNPYRGCIHGCHYCREHHVNEGKTLHRIGETCLTSGLNMKPSDRCWKTL